MKKSLSEITAPEKLSPVLFLILAAAAACLGQYYIAIGAAACAVIVFIYGLVSRRKKDRQLSEYIESAAYEAENARSSTLQNFPLPMAVFCLDDSRIIWGNDDFFRMCGEPGSRLDANLAELVPQFSGTWLLEGKTRYPTLLDVGGVKYQLFGNIIPPEHDSAESVSMGITYWVDVTEYDDLRIKYENSRPVVGIVIIDNLEELTKNQPERLKNDLRDAIEDKLSQWCSSFSGFIRRYDRDRYLLVMERQYLELLKAGQFRITQEMHEVVNSSGIVASISIGLSADTGSFAEALQFAESAGELALSRGGDQTVIKNRMSFEFYGGRGLEVEKRTRVKSRVMANAFAELIRESSKVLIMGHRFGDLDSYGAAVGVCSLARQLGVKAHIVADINHSAAKQLVDAVRKTPEYKDNFMGISETVLKTDARTLLIVVDTSRPEQVEYPELLRACSRVAVIDHHRVGATCIQDMALSMIEPYASSACELVTELLQELPDSNDILRCEAEALLAGIVLDTKSFSLRTGERTFDAASYLRRMGADTAAVKRLFQSNMEKTVARYKILQNVSLHRGVAVAVPEEPQDRVVAAQAADELLNISGVDASVVVAPDGKGSVFASARSIGELNVQLIMEKLGGGGNRSAAACQFGGESLPEAVNKVYAAIDDYFS